MRLTPQAALIDLLGRVSAGHGAAALVSEYELSQWPSAAVAALKSQGLITKARPASSAVCPGCERECVRPVHTLPTTTGRPASFIVCDKRSDINRVAVPIERLTQWQGSTDAVCGFVADSLELRRSDKRPVSVDVFGKLASPPMTSAAKCYASKPMAFWPWSLVATPRHWPS